jgi:hypothetical protein
LPIKANSFIRGGIGLRSSPMEQAAQSQKTPIISIQKKR